MTEDEAWERAGNMLLDSPLDGEEWSLARERLALSLLEPVPTLGQRFFAAALEAASLKDGHGSVAALAGRLGIQRATVSRWKCGQQAPTETHMKATAERLGLALCVIYDEGEWFVTFQDGT